MKKKICNQNCTRKIKCNKGMAKNYSIETVYVRGECGVPFRLEGK